MYQYISPKWVLKCLIHVHHHIVWLLKKNNPFQQKTAGTLGSMSICSKRFWVIIPSPHLKAVSSSGTPGGLAYRMTGGEKKLTVSYKNPGPPPPEM